MRTFWAGPGGRGGWCFTQRGGCCLVLRAMSDHDYLPATLTEARRQIATAVEEGDSRALLEIRSQADTYRHYWSLREDGRERANAGGEVKVRAEAGLGKIDAREHPHGGDHEQVQPALNLGINHDTRAAWRKLGQLSEERLAQLIALAREDQEAGVSTARLIQLIRFGSTMSSTTFECYTPARYVDAAREVLGDIDLDPASSAEANETVRAATYYDEEADGLEQPWFGRVFLNPPYGRSLTARFAVKLTEEYGEGHVDAGILLINAYGLDAHWFQPLFDGVLCFTDHRIPFYGGGPTFGSLFVYLGRSPAQFAEVFGEFGNVVRRWP